MSGGTVEIPTQEGMENKIRDQKKKVLQELERKMHSRRGSYTRNRKVR